MALSSRPQHAEQVDIRHRFNELTHGVLLYKRKGNTLPLGEEKLPKGWM